MTLAAPILWIPGRRTDRLGRLRRWRRELAHFMGLPVAGGGLPVAKGGLPANDSGGCLWGLTLCGGGDSGLRLCAGTLSAGGTYQYTDGKCYTINTSPSPRCGTLISASSLTAVSGCSDAACDGGGGGPSTCPDCSGVSDVYTLNGWNHNLSNCGSFDSSACTNASPPYPGWDDTLYICGDSTQTCSTCGFVDWSADLNASPRGIFQIYASDGTCGLLTGIELRCELFDTGIAWYLSTQVSFGPGGGITSASTYQKIGGATPVGTYTKVGTTASCTVEPATVSIS
jgi:hypothetical protein